MIRKIFEINKNNSLCLTIPQEAVKKLQLKKGCEVLVNVEGDTITLKKVILA